MNLSSKGVGSRREIAMEIGRSFSMPTCCACNRSRRSAESWRSRHRRSAVSSTKVGTVLGFLVIAPPCRSANVFSGEHPRAVPTPTNGEADMRRSAVTRTSQGVEPCVDCTVLLASHDQPRLIEERRRRIALACAMPACVLARVGGIRPNPFGTRTTAHGSYRRHADGNLIRGTL